MAPEKPINADLRPDGTPEEGAPAPGPPAEPSGPPDGRGPRAQSPPATATAETAPRWRRKQPPAPGRRPVPGALKAIAALFALAVVFLAAAIVGGGNGGSGGEDEPSGAPAPIVAPPSEPPRPAEQPADETAQQLGYPAFATANTTRVGGADAVANAAGVALAVYPSAGGEQRPDAVALADAADWRPALAAAVLMAPPLGVPLLVSEASEVPETTATALEALDPPGSKETRGAQAFVLGRAAAPSGLETRRVRARGAAGAAAILALRERLAGSPPRHIVVASASKPGLAMPAAAWAARSGDPVLFTGPRRLAGPTAKALEAHPDVPVFVLGPSSAIPSKVLRRISEISADVSRVSGEDPVANAVAFARYSDGGFGWNVNDPGHGFVVARADEPLDAAAAAPLSASGTWGPLLLTDRADTLPEALRGYLLDVKPGYTDDPTRAFYNHVWVIGDQEAIDVREQAEIDEVAALARIGGAQ